MQLRLGCLAKTKWSGPKVLVKGLLDPMSMYMAKNPALGCGVKARPVYQEIRGGVFDMKCTICNADLAEWEQDKLECGHYACNSCTYEAKVGDGLNILQCEKCFESTKETSDE